jgi:3-hydroxybutyryl-CoA dehydrogenase
VHAIGGKQNTFLSAIILGGLPMAIEKVGVVGCGLMGSGIAQVAASAGFQVTVREVSPQLVEKGLQSIDKNLQRLVDKGTLPQAERDKVRGRLRGTTNLEDLKDCDIVIEAIIEQLPAKARIVGRAG